MKIPIKIVKAFTTDSHSGNPAGVIFNTMNLDSSQMQIIAQQVGVSECVFITQNNTLYNLRYFSPAQEMDFCGHATIAAFHAMDLEKPCSLLFETRLGHKKIAVYANGIYFIDMGILQQHYPIKETLYIADLIGTKSNTIHMAHVFSVGVPKLLIKVSNLNTLFELQPKFQEISHFCKTTGIRGFYPFTQETLLPDSTFHARQFNPLAGIDEDPITGIAGAALGAWYGKNCIIEQGSCMNAFGRMYIEVNETIRVGGHAVTSADICIEI